MDCDVCGTALHDKCLICGAPQCCPKCCREAWEDYRDLLKQDPYK